MIVIVKEQYMLEIHAEFIMETMVVVQNHKPTVYIWMEHLQLPIKEINKVIMMMQYLSLVLRARRNFDWVLMTFILEKI